MTGLSTILAGFFVGKATDAIGRVPVFLIGSLLTTIMVLIYTHLNTTPLAIVIAVNVLLFIGIFSRMIPFQAMMTSVPELTKRWSFNAVNASIQQFAGGVASLIAGHVIAFGADGKLLHFPMVGYIMVGTTLVTALLVWNINKAVLKSALK